MQHPFGSIGIRSVVMVRSFSICVLRKSLILFRSSFLSRRVDGACLIEFFVAAVLGFGLMGGKKMKDHTKISNLMVGVVLASCFVLAIRVLHSRMDSTFDLGQLSTRLNYFFHIMWFFDSIHSSGA